MRLSSPYQRLIGHFQDSHLLFLVTVMLLGINPCCTSPKRTRPSICCPLLVMGTMSLDFKVLKATLWKNSANFVKDVRMIYVNFIIIVVTVPEKKKEALLCNCPLYHCYFLRSLNQIAVLHCKWIVLFVMVYWSQLITNIESAVVTSERRNGTN